MDYAKKAMEIRLKITENNPTNMLIANSYSNISLIYNQMPGKEKEALEYSS